MATEIELPHRYDPRGYQLDAWRAMDEFKRCILVWHRRAGKDKLCFNKLICKAIETPANYAYYFPTAKLGRKALWKNFDVSNGMAVIDHIPQGILKKKPNQTEMMIELINGSTIQVLGTDNLDVVGGNYHGVVFSEYSLQNPLAWEYTRPILLENGGWSWKNGTPRGENHLYDLLKTNRENPNWFTQVLSIKETKAVTEAQIDEERRSGRSESRIRQEYYCDFSVANERAIYGRFLSDAQNQGRIGGFPVDGRAPVFTFWDLGSPRNTVVWYGQPLAYGVMRWIDCDYGLELTLAERVAHMNKKGYNLDKHFLPHDAKQTARHGKTFEQDAREAGLRNIVVVPQTADVWTGINRVAQLMPSFEFRTPACDVGIKGLKAYESAPDSSSGIIRNEPLHTWASHIADGIRTYAEAETHGLLPKFGAAVKPASKPIVALTGSRMF